ncbi:MAG: S9 family peptidase [Gemmatimonadetes bacterium]|nr:S9 family peptidase [Gemmatimonadota bacterium]MDA1102029.1 S9 family peptidase [Gemmatimonadota bacterium]
MNRILFGLATCLITVVPLEAQSRPISYDDYYRIESAGGATLSPDGSTVAFVRTRTLEEENRTHSEVWMVRADGSSAPSRLTSPATEAGDPQWSPDGKLLSFSSRRIVAGEESEGSTWFLRMDRPGEAFQLPGLAGTPIFDPNNRWIAFTRPVAPSAPRPALPEMTEEERRIVDRFDGRAYDWMQFRFDRRGYLPDPTDPYATPSTQIFVVPVDGGEARQVTELPVNVSGVSWRPNGTGFVFTADEHQRDEHTYPRADLWTVTLDGAISRLTDDEYNWNNPQWSPDGRWFVASGQVGLDVIIRERWDHGSPTDLWLFSADGAQRRNLTADWDLLPGSPTWSADGQSLYFTAGIGGDTHLLQLDVATGRVDQLTFGEGRLGSVSFSSDASTLAYIRQDATHPGDVYAGAVGGTARQLTSINAGLLAEVELQSPQLMTFSSPDGTTVEGWVIPPRGYREGDGRRWPMVLNMHGGPHGSYGNSFSFDFQLQSSRGYFVLYTNPRASTGYGEAFLWGTWGSWGDEDYDDVMAGVDAALERFPIDDSRMGVTGYSYGGYLTNWVITQTDRFAAATAGAGISNWVSDYAVADIPRTKETEFYGTPWEKEGLANLLAASPIVHAEGVSTPTLFVHGESDFRVPIEEAEQMYVALQKQGVPAKMVRYPDSYHGGWTPWRTLHRLYSTLEWWDQWLAEKPIS